MILTPKNWNSFQHYKDRAPSWIKLHKALLDDFEFSCLPVASKALAPLLWLLASEYDDGKIDASLDKLAFRLRMTRGEMAEALSPLIEKGFFDASEMLAEPEHVASPEKEREIEDIDKRERREDTREVALADDWPSSCVDDFWALWPNKVGKPAAVKALASARRRRASFAEIMFGVGEYIRDKPPDRPWLNPATFLNQNRWEDQPAAVIAISAKPLTEFQRKQQETNDVRQMLRNSGSGGGTLDRLLSDDHGQRPESVRGGPGSNILALPGALGSGSS